VREDALRERQVELSTEPGEPEGVVDEQHRLPIHEPFRPKLLPAAGDQARVDVEAVIVTRLEVANEMHASAQAATADIDEMVMRLQTLLDQELELAAPDRLPHGASADGLPMVEATQTRQLHVRQSGADRLGRSSRRSRQFEFGKIYVNSAEPGRAGAGGALTTRVGDRACWRSSLLSFAGNATASQPKAALKRRASETSRAAEGAGGQVVVVGCRSLVLVGESHRSHRLPPSG